MAGRGALPKTSAKSVICFVNLRNKRLHALVHFWRHMQNIWRILSVT